MLKIKLLQLHFLLLPLFLIFKSQPISAQGNNACVPSRLTDDDARILLYATPDAISVRKSGTDVDIEEDTGFKKEYPPTNYFVAWLVSRKGDMPGRGYFAVDKRSAVVESLSDFTEVKGAELMRIQEWMRHGHCIYADSRHHGKKSSR